MDALRHAHPLIIIPIIHKLPFSRKQENKKNMLCVALMIAAGLFNSW